MFQYDGGKKGEEKDDYVRVLLVDDQKPFLLLSRKIVSRMTGMEVVGEAADGVAAVKMAEELRPDLVLMDVQMPGLNGFQASARILEKLPGTRIVILSAYDENEYLALLQEVKVVGFISKTNFNARTLGKLLDKSAENQRSTG